MAEVGISEAGIELAMVELCIGCENLGWLNWFRGGSVAVVVFKAKFDLFIDF